jgi:electron-transferring-flavoprotein dehydrogenase
MGIDADGKKATRFGIDLHAKVTVFGEGSRKSHDSAQEIPPDRQEPQSYVVGVKEVWELPGRIQPKRDSHQGPCNQHHGGFVYGMKDNKVAVGLLVGLDYRDPFMDPHREFQKLKLHPTMAELLKDGKLIQYGAKTAPVGGFFSVPKLVFPGGMLVGDAASLFISMKLKGIHAAMKSGMLAAECIFEGLLKGISLKSNCQSTWALEDSYIGSELPKSRNFHWGSAGTDRRAIKGACTGF